MQYWTGKRELLGNRKKPSFFANVLRGSYLVLLHKDKEIPNSIKKTSNPGF
jgi:hypothetical protein